MHTSPPDAGRAAATPREDLPTLSVCLRCRPPGWTGTDEDRPGATLCAALEAALAEAGLPAVVAVRRVRCMSQCKRPCVVAFAQPGRFTYLFGDLDPALHTADVVAAFQSWLSRPDGFLDRADRPAVMRAGILGRIPPSAPRHPLVETEAILRPTPSDAATPAPSSRIDP